MNPGISPHFRSNRHHSKGFTLTEVMVALIIIAIGTLGIAKMQAVALSSTGASRSRALAALEASSLAGAMHANRAYWQTATSLPGNIGLTTSVTASGPTFALTSDQGAMQTALTNAQGSTQACPTTTTAPAMPATLSCYCALGSGTACSAAPVNMAANDLVDWGAGLASLVPSATATVQCVMTDIPVDCTIGITWTENAVSLTQQEQTAETANTTAGTTASFQKVTYSLYVVP